MRRLPVRSSTVPLAHREMLTESRDEFSFKVVVRYADSPDYSKLEADVCYNQRLACLESLTRWQELVDESLEQVTDYDAHGRALDADTQKLWGEENKDPYLRLFVLSAAKVKGLRDACLFEYVLRKLLQ